MQGHWIRWRHGKVEEKSVQEEMECQCAAQVLDVGDHRNKGKGYNRGDIGGTDKKNETGFRSVMRNWNELGIPTWPKKQSGTIRWNRDALFLTGVEKGLGCRSL